MNKSIKIMFWNANGMQKHMNELQLVLNTQNIDICLIAETHYTKQSYFKIAMFETYFTIHPRNCARGGSAILVRSAIKHHEDQKICTEEFQATSIAININGQQLNIAAVYSPPRHNIKYDQYKEFFQQTGERFIMGGDFNAKNVHWGSRLTNPKGKEMLKSSNDSGCDFIVTRKPTYWPTDPQKLPDLIDFFVLRKISKNYLKIEEGVEMNSDHSPIYLTLNSSYIEKDCNPFLSNKYTDWSYFRHILCQEVFINPTNEEDIEDCTRDITRIIQKAAWQSTPKPIRSFGSKTYPHYIREMVAEKRKLRRKWQRSRNPNVKTQLNKAAKNLSSAIKEFEDLSMQKYLTELSNDKVSNYSLWKATKSSNRPQVQIPPLKIDNANWAKSNKQKVDHFAKHLRETFSSHDSCVNTSNDVVEHLYDETIAVYSANEVKFFINQLII